MLAGVVQGDVGLPRQGQEEEKLVPAVSRGNPPFILPQTCWKWHRGVLCPGRSAEAQLLAQRSNEKQQNSPAPHPARGTACCGLGEQQGPHGTHYGKSHESQNEICRLSTDG